MGQQTVLVIANDRLDSLDDPDFVDKLKAAIDQTVRTHQPADIGVDIGTVMPYHHSYDPTVYLSCGGEIWELGKKTVESTPKDKREAIEHALQILQG